MKKGFKIAGMIVSLALVIFGILIMTGTFRDSISYPGFAPSSYDSGYAIFGADFYSYVCNNSAEAADAANAAAYNTGDIIELLTSGFGVIIIAMGLLGFCFFGMMPTGAFRVQNIAPAAIPAFVAPAAPATAPAAAPATVTEPEPIAVTEPEPIAVTEPEPEKENQPAPADDAEVIDNCNSVEKTEADDTPAV